jgi:CubicO group peptidase (beta-lactamase class C family)
MSRLEFPRTMTLLERSLREDRAAMAVQICVTVDGERVLEEAIGQAEPCSGATPATVFRVYCATKPVTALAIGRLLDAGALSLDEPLRETLPGVRALAEADITARHILNHTAGVHEVSPVHALFLLDDARRDFVDRARVPEGWRIGVDAGYSEYAGWHLLGRLIEATTGEPLRQHLRESILDPLGLHNTWIGMTQDEYESCYPRLGLNYDVSRERPLPMLYERSKGMCRDTNCAYGGYTTASDLASLYASVLTALDSHEVAGLPSTDTLRTLCTSARPRTRDVVLERECEYGLGFMTNLRDHDFGDRCSTTTFGHSGWLGASFGFADPEHGLAVGLVMNGILIGGNALGRRCAVVDAIYADLGHDDLDDEARGPRLSHTT